MTHPTQPLIDQISQFAHIAPEELVAAVARAIEQTPSENWFYFRAQVLQTVPQPHLRDQLSVLLHTWQSNAAALLPGSLALALRAARQSERECRHRSHAALVWTGPDGGSQVLRRTDQALLQVINSAQHSLLVVSFAVYKIANIRRALLAAAERNVEIRICLEAPDPSAGKITFDTLKALGQQVAKQATVYVWPAAQRPHTTGGKHGSLHVKCAVADEQLLFISSANLTEYALSLNMELGVLIEGGPLPGEVRNHFDLLIEQQVLVQV